MAVVNSAAMNVEVHISFRIRVFNFSRYMPRSGTAGSSGSSIFSFFKELLYWSPQWLYQLTFPPTVQEGSLFSPPSPTILQYWFIQALLSRYCCTGFSPVAASRVYSVVVVGGLLISVVSFAAEQRL